MQSKKYIAIDLGAESGRVMLGTVSQDKLVLEEVHRFLNGPIEVEGTLRWDFPYLFGEIKAGLKQAAQQVDGDITCIAVDSWGVDFGLLDENGQLLEKPYHYRDSRTVGIMDKAFEIVGGKRAIYEQTGIQFMQLNTIYQLLAMRQANDPMLERATSLLFTADLVACHFCGKQYAEYTLASTSQLMNMNSGQWAVNIFEKLEIPIKIMPPVVEPGTVVGQLTRELAAELGCSQIPVAAVGSHDTASAVAAVPAAADSNWAYLSCGTWSLLGVEITKPVVNDQTFEWQFTNEGGVNGTIRLLKNIMGLWLVQECRRYWQSEGRDFSYTQLTEMAAGKSAFSAYIDLSYPDFLSPGQMPEKINNYLNKSGQQIIEDEGMMIRSILESLALNYARVLEHIEQLIGSGIDTLHIVGGGIQNELLCQFAANATGKRVVTGPVEATASGNILMQAKAIGQIQSLEQIRQIVQNSFDLKEYQPEDTSIWRQQSNKYKPVT